MCHDDAQSKWLLPNLRSLFVVQPCNYNRFISSVSLLISATSWTIEKITMYANNEQYFLTAIHIKVLFSTMLLSNSCCTGQNPCVFPKLIIYQLGSGKQTNLLRNRSVSRLNSCYLVFFNVFSFLNACFGRCARRKNWAYLFWIVFAVHWMNNNQFASQRVSLLVERLK